MAKLLITKQKKAFVEELGREVVVAKAKQYLVEDTSKDFHTTFGTIKAADLAKNGTVKTSQGREFKVLEATFIDLYKRLRKLPQTIPLKDIGLILAETGANKDTIAIDAGAGSAALACMLGHVCKQVTTYEVREDFLENIKENISRLSLSNVTLKHRDVHTGFDEQDVDLVTLDLPDPWVIAPLALNALRAGGWLVVYSPTLPQIVDTVDVLATRDDALVVKTVEIIERLWEASGRRVRPKSTPIGHSGFLLFARKLP
ncbi:methyltransferase domain-containing protein [Candidatus Woesearchaeota archaeon]|nr:methyltransferase domain-containing protein [Candidatus Woesearchaeota archaeon]